MTILLIDPYAGVAGDMLLAGLIDAGASEDAVRTALMKLSVEGWSLRFEPVQRGAVRALRAAVETTEQPTHRRLSDIERLLTGAGLSDGVRERSQRTFRLLAEAEAQVHGSTPEEIHFHEVGAVDAIVDVVGVAAALEDLGPERVLVRSIPLGDGTARSEHGDIPIPGPAVTELLGGMVVRAAGEGEVTTPTGAALLRANAEPDMGQISFALHRTGWGAGTRDTERPNVLRVMVGEEVSRRNLIHLIESNIDDMSPELLPYVIERLLEAGAHDAWFEGVAMKKGRLARKLVVLADPVDSERLQEIVFHETTTLGLRIRDIEKVELERRWETVVVEGHEIRLKIALSQGQETNVAPEYEDTVKVARATGLALQEVYRRALDARQN